MAAAGTHGADARRAGIRRGRLAGAAAVLVLALAAPAWSTPSAEPEPALLESAAAGDFAAHYRLGEHFATRGGPGDLDRALEHFRSALSGYEAYAGAGGTDLHHYQRRVADAYAALGRHEEARAALSALVATLEARQPGSLDLAHAYMSLGTQEHQLGSWQAAIDLNRSARAIFAAAAGQDDEAKLWSGATFFNEALNLASSGRPDDAYQAYGQAALLYRPLAGGESRLSATAAAYLADTVWNQGTLAAARGDAAAARALRQERVDLLRVREPSTAKMAWALFDLAKSAGEAGDHELALALVEEGAAIRDPAGFDGSRTLEFTWQRGYELESLGRSAEALLAYQSAVEQIDPAHAAADVNAAALWGNIATLRFNKDDQAGYRDALARQVGHLRRLEPGGLALANAVQALSIAQAGAGAKDEALAAAEEDVALRRLLEPGTPELGYALDNLGRRLLDLQDGRRAVPVFEEALEIGRTADPEWRTTFVLSRINLGIGHFFANDYDSAISAYETALQEIDAAQDFDKANTAILLGNLSDLARSIGFYAQAETASLRQIALLREIAPSSPQLATALYLLSYNYYGLARFEEALTLIREAREIYLANTDPDNAEYIETFRQEGWYLEGAGRRDEALAVLEDGLARARKARGDATVEYANMLSGHAWVLRKTGRLKQSEDEFRTALAIIERELGPADLFTTSAYINLAILSQLNGKNQDAVRLCMKALANIQRDPRSQHDGQRWTYETLSLAFRDMGDTRRAILFAKQAINVQQELRSYNKSYSKDKMEGFRREWRRLYDNLADMLIAEGRISEAQAVLAMEKEEELVDFIQRDASADLRDSRAEFTETEAVVQQDLGALLEKPIAAARALADLSEKQATAALSAEEEERLAALEASLDESYATFMDDVDAFLAKASEEDAAVQQEAEAINLDYTADAQEELRALGGRAAMLQVASLDAATHLFLTVPDAAIHREVPIERAKLSRLVFEALSAVESRDPAAREKLQALYDVLVRPVAEELRDSGAETVMLNLQGFLRYVPFAALHDGERYLVEEYALSVYTPAAKTRFEAAARDAGKSAGFGVTASHAGFSPLPGVGREIEAIFGTGGQGGALRGSASLDEQFTREAFQKALKGRPEIVHIASHFKLVPGRETDSFLLLGDGSPLSLSDIRKGRGFRFGGVDLLTLSACDTARGGESEGDEVESFGALAQMNGASAVMATLWPVADEATAQLMQSFYGHMMEGRLDKASALRAAQIEQIHRAAATGTGERGAAPLKAGAGQTAASDPSHPYFWSPFILMGNWL